MPTKQEILDQSLQAIGDFFKLSKYLLGEDAPYDVNEIPEDSPYYGPAKSVSEEMGLDWSGMAHEDSNRVILNLLSEYFCAIYPDESYYADITISFKKSK